MLKNGKAAGVDDVPAEFLKILEGEALKKLVESYQSLFATWA